jgi:hypothetical protein
MNSIVDEDRLGGLCLWSAVTRQGLRYALHHMLSSVGLGLLKGLLVGALLGVGLTYGLRWSMPESSLLGYLAAIAVGGTTGVLAGRAPWREGAWLEALIKCVLGAAIGPGLYWLACQYLSAALPSFITNALHVPTSVREGDAPLSWVAFAPALLGAVGVLLGLVIELDHAFGGDDDKSGKPKAKKKTDVFADTESGAQSTKPSKRLHERRD